MPQVPVVWRLATVRQLIDETPRARTLVLDVPDWPGHIAGQHVDVRLTADDGYQTERSFSIASAPERATVALTVERIDGGEVSPYLTEELRVGDQVELRGPFTSYFVWRTEDGGPLLLIAGGSGLVPLMAMLRHRAAGASTVEARLLLSARSTTCSIGTNSRRWRRETAWPCTTRSRASRPRTGAGSRAESTQRC